MEALATSTAVAGPSSEVSTPAAHDEDARFGHFAINKPTATSTTTVATPSQSPELTAKDVKSLGTRFHEDCHETDGPGLRLRPSRMFKGKETVVVRREQKKPLQLLDLPVDILKDIVKEVTHTNDLTSLALCHSALHRLTIPHIYSRFDIVWPDSTTHAEPRSGVDALTFGLATLVMAEEIFGEAPNQEQHRFNRFGPIGCGQATETAIRRRRGNHYAQFTKKFSLGNGPADWVQEYLITKEGGKMLGTLVALAVARMRSLETFVWDMPTGILRDVWLCLSSLGVRDDGGPCKLEKVWVRWHDNTSADTVSPIPPPPAPINLTGVPLPMLQTSTLDPPMLQMHPAALDRVEHPSFSVLPPLKSLSVLDIDELAYLGEMAVLIGKSTDRLKEMRVGIARHAVTRDWVTVWEGDNVQQVDPHYAVAGSPTIGEKRLGGVLGILTGFVRDMRKPRMDLPDRSRFRTVSNRTQANSADFELTVSTQESAPQYGSIASPEGMPSFRDVVPELPENEADSSLAPPSPPVAGDAPSNNVILAETDVAAATSIPSPDRVPDEPSSPEEARAVPADFVDDQSPRLENVLHLESLELERVPLSVPVAQKAIDWTRLTSLTLLHCPNHEQLWKTLRRQFVPTARSPACSTPRRTPNSSPKKGSKATMATGDDLEYKLNLKKIHTNTVSPALISFLKETLAPNSLEVLFLQEARMYSPSVQVDAIYRGPLRRHRGSLKKLMIDSSEKGPDGLHANSSRWRKWILTREVLAFVCSGKMPSLRELGMAIDYRDWHFFLQHLPAVPQLRSLYLPFLADHIHGANLDPRELALQIVDIVALRPEVELCYMGIANKCFEILENRRDWDSRAESQLGFLPGGSATRETPLSEDDEEEDDGDDDVEDVEDEGEEEDDTESDDDDADDDTDSDTDGPSGLDKYAARLRLREILFYDDKVAIFKARHGRL